MPDSLSEIKAYIASQYNRLLSYKDANTPRNTRPPVSVSKVINEGLLNPNKYNAVAANRFKDSALGLLGGVPGAGDYASGVQAADYWNRGEKGNALLAGIGALPVIPSLVGAGATLGGLGVMHKVAQKIGKPLPSGPARKQAGAIVYHGSPHKFDQFDMSKIGTGEGAQAYGHGLYFAENPAVAQEYQNSVGRNLDQLIDIAKSKGMSDDVARDLASAFQSGKRFDDYVYAAKDTLDSPLANEAQQVAASKLLNEEWPAYEAYSAFKEPGQLYKVDIPDESIPKMLDWDKPLSEQAESVRTALANSKNKQVRSMLEYAKTPYSTDIGGDQKTMGEAFRLLNMNLSGKSSADTAQASALLAKHGIPGIRYLDGASRGNGAGTSNYVLFDDQLPRILEVNGQPTGLRPWSEDAIGFDGQPINPHGKIRRK